MAYALSRDGLCAMTAHDDASARAAVEAHLPAVVVLDSVGFGGLEWLHAAGQRPAIVILSTLELENARAAVLELGAAYYLNKPFSHRALVDSSAAASELRVRGAWRLTGRGCQ